MTSTTETQQAFKQLCERNAKVKPGGADRDWMTLSAYYNDEARDITIGDLATLGVGLKDNTRPLECMMLQRIVNRLATVYASPPLRWLKRKRRRLAESNSAHQAMLDVLERAQYDLSWKRIDALATLLRVIGVRFYPSDQKGSVVLRVFEPFNMMRDPDPSAADQIEADRSFALLLEKCGTEEVWEFWQRTGTKADGSPEWRCTQVDQKGAPTGDQPFASTDLVSPYDKLPVMLVYDELAMGRAWLTPRSSRISNQRAVNAIANDLWSLVTHQAHSKSVLKSDNPDSAPTIDGHGGTVNIGTKEDFNVVTPNPKIAESQNVLDYIAFLWALGEDHPVNEFSRSTQVLTGAALMVTERPLDARREARVPLAIETEREAWGKFRCVHNLHVAARASATWSDQELLAEDTQLEVEIAEVSAPQDAKALQDVSLRDVLAGAASIIDYIGARDRVNRAKAIATWERVQEDNKAYPPGQLDQTSAASSGAANAADAATSAAPGAGLEAAAAHTDVAAAAGVSSVVQGVQATKAAA